MTSIPSINYSSIPKQNPLRKVFEGIDSVGHFAKPDGKLTYDELKGGSLEAFHALAELAKPYTSVIPINGLTDWFLEKARTSNIAIEETSIDSIAMKSPWRTSNGSILRSDQKFFQVIGLNIYNKTSGDTLWWQPIIKEKSEKGITGTIVLIQDSNTNEVLVSLRKYEPGVQTPGRLILGTSFQGSRTTIEGVKGNTKKLFDLIMETLEQPSTKTNAIQTTQPIDGNRFLNKKIQVIVVKTEKTVISKFINPETQRWSTPQELEHSISLGYTNQHLRDTYLQLLMAK